MIWTPTYRSKDFEQSFADFSAILSHCFRVLGVAARRWYCRLKKRVVRRYTVQMVKWRSGHTHEGTGVAVERKGDSELDTGGQLDIG